jgi:hypothetical protein
MCVISVPTRNFSPHRPLFTFLVLSLSRTAIAIGGGDYPKIRKTCLFNFPHAVDSAPCNIDAKDRAPVLQFSSVYRLNAEILPHMIAMPMPTLHLPCFVEWVANGRVCTILRMELYFDMSGLTSFEVRLVKNCLIFRHSLDWIKLRVHHSPTLTRTSPTKSFGAVLTMGTSIPYTTMPSVV